LSDFTPFSGGPGAGKFDAGRLRLATTALARETPGEELELLELVVVLELPQAARIAALATAPTIATKRETLGFTSGLGMSSSFEVLGQECSGPVDE
jgi:hypothetical protein